MTRKMLELSDSFVVKYAPACLGYVRPRSVLGYEYLESAQAGQDLQCNGQGIERRKINGQFMIFNVKN